MSGALPDSSPAPTINSSRSRLVPPEKPASSMHDSVVSISNYPSEDSSRAVSHQTESSPKNSSCTPSQSDVVIVPSESLEGSEVAASSSLSTHCIISPRPVSPTTFIEMYEANDAAGTSDIAASSISSKTKVDNSSFSASSISPLTTSSMSSSRIVTLTQSSKQEHEYQDESRPVTLSLSKQKDSKQEAYYNWKVPKDSLYSISTEVSKSSPSHHESSAPGKATFASSKPSDHHGDLPSRETGADTDGSLLTRSRRQHTLPEGYRPPPRSLSVQSASTLQTTDGRVQEKVSERTRTSGQNQSARCIPLPASRPSSSKSKTSRSSTTSTRRSTRSASQKLVYEEREWETPLSGAAAFECTIDEHSERPASHHTGPKTDGWGEAAEWEDQLTSSRRSRSSRTSRPHQSSSHKTVSIGPHANEVFEQEHIGHGLWAVERRGPQQSTKSTSSINVEEDLLHYLPALSDDARLPPPMPMLTTIYEESEPTPSSHAPSMLTQESTRFARPGAITPHPLSSVSSAATARKPPTDEPQRLEYKKPYVESKSSSSASSRAHDSNHSRRSSRPRMLEERAYRLGEESSRSRSSKERKSGSAQLSRRSSDSAKASGGDWKFW